ncbi:enoyl-CoA hydratase-related protein [Glacieibacterium megasporae]|uniref:enoyl-CoA hydratase-related protein n=1 Tax=Glacieibacterium megasporae TaxID=2835787 RepID=UPI001C1E5D01|nr:enoyl-CoA hydratase-related protein [Polymorphobacter megasporae]UAJ10511.1 enoyl-CoA hydratase/isomerase family protein [Polymorphobacter megasporae]
MSLVESRRIGSSIVLTLQDPGRRNILSPELCRELSKAVAAANADTEARAIIITGASPAFCGGADLADLQAAADGHTEALHAVYQAFINVADSPLPTVAAVNGAAIGAGMNLALACDIRVADEDALFDTRFLKIGLHPGGGHGWMLLRAVGWAEATRLLLFARSIGADEAHRIGLVQQVAPAGGLLTTALELTGRADALPRDLILETKASLRLAVVSDHVSTFVHETERQLHSLQQPAFVDLVRRLQARIETR